MEWADLFFDCTRRGNTCIDYKDFATPCRSGYRDRCDFFELLPDCVDTLLYHKMLYYSTCWHKPQPQMYWNSESLRVNKKEEEEEEDMEDAELRVTVTCADTQGDLLGSMLQARAS